MMTKWAMLYTATAVKARKKVHNDWLEKYKNVFNHRWMHISNTKMILDLICKFSKVPEYILNI